MNDKEVKTAITRLLEATARLEDSTSNLNKTINKMTAMVFMSVCSMAICCIILSIIDIFLSQGLEGEFLPLVLFLLLNLM